MTPLVFIDANVPMYAGGARHDPREPCLDVLNLAAMSPRSFITSAEVLQELLHRYRAMREWARGRRILQRFSLLMQGRIEPVLAVDVDRAAALADTHPDVAARDLLHAAVMLRAGATAVVSADRDFDRITGVTRLDPRNVGEWRDSLV